MAMTASAPAAATGPHALEPTDGLFSLEELQLAGRNRGLPLEAMRFDLTPNGLHYLLVHFDIPAVNATRWRLQLTGAVTQRRTLSLEEIRAYPRRTIPVTLECAGNGRALLHPRPVSQPWLVEAIGTAEWTGAALGPLLEEVGLAHDAVEVVFTGEDRGVQGGQDQQYARSLPLADAMRPEVLLAYEMNGEPLPPQHGFPLRLIVPGWYGTGPVLQVRVRVDSRWFAATLTPPVGPFAWCGWYFDWDARPGEHQLSVLAIDALGDVQPTEQSWNYQGMGNNLVQRVAVTVR